QLVFSPVEIKAKVGDTIASINKDVVAQQTPATLIGRSGGDGLPTRGFLPWRFSNAGLVFGGQQWSMKGRHPKTFTQTTVHLGPLVAQSEHICYLGVRRAQMQIRGLVEEPAMLRDGITIGHSGDIVANDARPACFAGTWLGGGLRPFDGHQIRASKKPGKKFANDPARLLANTDEALVPVHVR